MSVRARAANLLWAAGTIPAWRRYRRALGEPLRAQASLLQGYLRDNRDTEYGREFGFDALLDVVSTTADDPAALEDLIASYQSRVPLVRYDDIERRVRAVACGSKEVLTRDEVVRLTPSSGSTSPAKLLPFTRTLQRELSRGVDAWLADLFLRDRRLAGGRAYWSISPAAATDCSGPVPIGFDDDSEYLGGLRSALARAVSAVPDIVCRITDVEAFRYTTLLFLVRAGDLRLVSIWHPSFLTRLLESLPQWFDPIVRDIETGRLSPPGCIPDDVRSALAALLRADQRRAGELQSLSAWHPHSIWPELALISCWDDGPASAYAEDLRSRVAPVRMQPKGLVATEGIVTIPFQGLHPLAVTSHFLEFLDEDARPRLAHQLRTGAEYGVALTTGAGLYRYRLGDRVVVDGWCESTPSVRFVGRDDRVSDLFGEKLSEGFVAAVIGRLVDNATRFAMLAPERDSTGIFYTLFVETDLPRADLEIRLERALCDNPHYAWCRDLGQLGPARVRSVGPNADRRYVDRCVERGQRLGDVKPALLHRDVGWSAVLCPQPESRRLPQ